MTCQTICQLRDSQKRQDKALNLGNLTQWSVTLSFFSSALTKEILGHLNGDSTWTSPAGLWLALHSTTSSETAAGTELSGNGYARTQVVLQYKDDRSLDNASLIVGPTASAQWSDVLSVSLHDSSSGGTYLAGGNLSSALSIAANKSYSIPAGSLTLEV